jgi:hypothetical protein
VYLSNESWFSKIKIKTISAIFEIKSLGIDILNNGAVTAPFHAP